MKESWNTTYQGFDTKPADLDSFWMLTRGRVEGHAIDAIVETTLYHYGAIQSDHLMLHGLDGTLIHGWYLHQPASKRRCLLTTHGYRSSRKQPHLYLHWLAVGYDVVVIDQRLQGGETLSNSPIHLEQENSLVSINIDDLTSSYLYWQYTDMMIAVHWIRQMGYAEYVTEGTSQAGGLAITTAALMGGAKGVFANVPSYSDLDVRIRQASGSFGGITQLIQKHPSLEQSIRSNICYFDTKNLIDWLDAPLFASVGGRDETCPMEQFFATYNRYAGEKQLTIYPENGHEGGGLMQTEKVLQQLQKLQ